MRFLELFAGAGGADLGLLRAGHEVVRAVEWNADAAATLRATGAEVYCGDVRHSDAYLGLPPVDALWASPPCQDWSSAGKRAGANGERNGWPWTLDVIDFLRATGRGPAWAIFENVVGLTHHTGGCRCPHGPVESCPAGYFHRWILPELRKRFAHVAYEILDAASFGVPQRRHRVFIVCGPEEYRWPKPTHADPDLALSPIGKMMGLQPWRTVRQALGDVVMLTTSGTVAGFSDRTVVGVGESPSPPVTTQVGKKSPWMNAGVPFIEEHDGERPTVNGHPVTVSRNGRARIEYALNETPETMRGPSDLVRRHPIELPDQPANTVATGRPIYVLEDPRHPYATDDEPAPTVRAGGAGHSAPPMWLRTEMTGASSSSSSSDEPAPTVGGKANTYLHAVDPGTRLDRPAPTVAAGNGGKGCGQWSASADVRAECERDTGRRRITVMEAAALQSFPPDHPWQGTQTSQYAQVGNAVPPPLAEALARALPR